MANRLIHEDSPYLRQHAENPVEWYPWGEEAFEKARKEQRPIFLSIGYSSCHWCHVMEREVFEDETIAAYLNAHFVSIKVDREERPDIDKHFQEVHQTLTRRPGGWPTSIFLTPDLHPFFAATYIPPRPRYNMMGFLELCEKIVDIWEHDRQKILQSAAEIDAQVRPRGGPVQATKLDEGVIDRFLEQTHKSFDPTYGGFSPAPKFPHTSTMMLLLHLSLMRNDPKIAHPALFSLREMAKGGLRDLIDGGFCRYSVDERWLVPHFEKMTYDNALLCNCYAQAYRISLDPFYLQIAREIAAFMMHFMQEEHLFYSASDADSEGVEGRYFVYTYEEAIEAFMNAGFTRDEARNIAQRLSITPEGNFEGKNIVRNEALLHFEGYDQAIEALRTLRKSRAYPFIDKKVIVSWNAMMIQALFRLGTIDPEYLPDAQASLEALLQKMYPDKRLYHSALIDATPKIEAFLEDYAYLCDALIMAHQTTLQERYLELAKELAKEAMERFYDGGRWYFSTGAFPTEAEATDSSYPSSLGVMLSALLSLGMLLEEPSYREIVFRSLERVSLQIVRYPAYTATLVSDTIRYLEEDLLLKASKEDLIEAATLELGERFPPLLRKPLAGAEGYLLCKAQSCFAMAQDTGELKKRLEEL